MEDTLTGCFRIGLGCLSFLQQHCAREKMDFIKEIHWNTVIFIFFPCLPHNAHNSQDFGFSACCFRFVPKILFSCLAETFAYLFTLIATMFSPHIVKKGEFLWVDLKFLLLLEGHSYSIFDRRFSSIQSLFDRQEIVQVPQ